jgi:polyphenol oxidase
LIKSKKLSKFKNITHGFFNKLGGKSHGIYKSLNCGLGSADKKKNVLDNLKTVSKRIGSKFEKIVLLNQIHSNKLYFIDKNFKTKKNRITGDAIITDQQKIPLGILTADCAPILIFDKKKHIISAIHAGWKGAYKGIIQKVVLFMIKKGCEPKNMTAVIGPSIKMKNYQVKQDFKKKFLSKNIKNKFFFKEIKNIIYFDLRKYILFQLKILKIGSTDIINKDTFDAKNNFFSARRSISRKESDYGRNISIIMLN